MKSKHLVFMTGITLITCTTVAFVWAQSSNLQRTEEKKAVEPAANPKDRDPWVASGSYVIRFSPENDHVWAFSKHTGFWRKQSIENVPIPMDTLDFMNAHYFALEGKEMLYVFSGLKGIWVPLALKGETKPQISYLEDVILVQTEQSLSAFSAETATWDTIALKDE